MLNTVAMLALLMEMSEQRFEGGEEVGGEGQEETAGAEPQGRAHRESAG